MESFHQNRSSQEAQQAAEKLAYEAYKTEYYKLEDQIAEIDAEIEKRILEGKTPTEELIRLKNRRMGLAEKQANVKARQTKRSQPS